MTAIHRGYLAHEWVSASMRPRNNATFVEDWYGQVCALVRRRRNQTADESALNGGARYRGDRRRVR